MILALPKSAQIQRRIAWSSWNARESTKGRKVTKETEIRKGIV